jgi:hypothetical protein
MITSLSKHAVATAIAVGGLGAVAVQQPAQADGFSTSYTCDVPMLGSRTVVLDGWLTSPDQSVAGQPGAFQLHVAGLRPGAPVAVDSWSAAARVDVGGAESTWFRMEGSGGYLAPGQPISGDLSGGWTPAVTGTHVLSVGGITITVNSAAAGSVTARCVANEPRPAAETLSVLPAYGGGWATPVAPPYEVVAPPYNVIVPPYQHGWHRPIAPPHHGGWSRPGGPPHHGGWSRPMPPHHSQGHR